MDSEQKMVAIVMGIIMATLVVVTVSVSVADVYKAKYHCEEKAK